MSSSIDNKANATGSEGAATEFVISGMTCQNCARRAAQALQSVQGVAFAAVDLARSRATVNWLPAATPNPGAAEAAVRRVGFSAKLLPSQATVADTPETSGSNTWRLNVVLGLIGALPLALGEWVFHWHGQPWFRWVGFGLALMVQVLCGARFYRGAWVQLRMLSANMDTLVALGSSTAFGFSAWALVSGLGGHLYFLESTAILTLISLGHWLEARATERAASSLRFLLNLAPVTARRLGPGGSEIEVPVGELAVGDLVVVKPGDHVPTDGVVVEGKAAMDESMLTGESVPVEKSPGAIVYGGTVNPDGRLMMQVTATGQATALARIIAAVARAQNSRARIQRIGDRVSGVFVPVVVVIAIGTGLWWGLNYETASETARSVGQYLWPPAVPGNALAAAFIHAAGVLIVACPCAMGLATPAAIMVATNVAARRGFLVRDGTALEKAGSITTVLFDKTGTLTQGHPVVTSVKDLRRASTGAVSVESLAASLAAPSNHLISRAIGALKAQDTALPDRISVGHAQATLHATPEFGWTDWREVRGCGIEAQRDGRLWRLGSLSWLARVGVPMAPAESEGLAEGAQGLTVVGLSAGNELLGVLRVSDAPRARAESVVASLNQHGKRVCMVTGDRAGVARAIALRIGIKPADVFAEVPPEQKAAIVRELQEQGERVAFVGDGINDAPALEQADLGVAVGRASDIAREAADIVLLRSDLQAVLEAFDLAKITLRTIKQNLFWAFFYNAAAVPLAAIGFLSPIVCAATMGVSDLIVIGNALRLKLRKPAL